MCAHHISFYPTKHLEHPSNAIHNNFLYCHIAFTFLKGNLSQNNSMQYVKL